MSKSKRSKFIWYRPLKCSTKALSEKSPAVIAGTHPKCRLNQTPILKYSHIKLNWRWAYAWSS